MATIKLWDQKVGAVAEDPRSGQVVFEYAEDFRTSGLEISPLRLPLSLVGPQTFPELARSSTFQGLPGVLADSLPDAFGNAIINQYFSRQGRPEASLSPVQRLLYVGRRAMGALEFHPPTEGRRGAGTLEALDVARLVEQARCVIEGDTSVAIPDMMQLGISAGGARAKALVLWDRQHSRVRSGFATPAEGEESWLIKFDGVSKGGAGHELEKEFRPGPYGRIEFAYARLAAHAKIDMAETYLLQERDFAHFMTRRFDRVNGERLHLHTLGGMQHADYNVRQLLSYEDYFRTIQLLQLGAPALEQAWRRMVFNLAARNQDDHVKNISFLMDRTGRWRLAPAYDLTFAIGGEWAASHQMRVNGKDDRFTRDDLLTAGEKFGVAEDGANVLRDVEEALAEWPREAAAAGLDRGVIDRIQDSFRHFTS